MKKDPNLSVSKNLHDFFIPVELFLAEENAKKNIHMLHLFKESKIIEN